MEIAGDGWQTGVAGRGRAEEGLVGGGSEEGLGGEEAASAASSSRASDGVRGS